MECLILRTADATNPSALHCYGKDTFSKTIAPVPPIQREIPLHRSDPIQWHGRRTADLSCARWKRVHNSGGASTEEVGEAENESRRPSNQTPFADV